MMKPRSHRKQSGAVLIAIVLPLTLAGPWRSPPMIRLRLAISCDRHRHCCCGILAIYGGRAVFQQGNWRERPRAA